MNTTELGRKFEIWFEYFIAQQLQLRKTRRNILYIAENKRKQVDIEFEKRKLIRKELYLIECKFSNNSHVDESAIDELLEKATFISRYFQKAHAYMVATNSRFTKKAKQYAQKHDIQLYDIETLMELYTLNSFVKSFFWRRKTFEKKKNTILEEILAIDTSQYDSTPTIKRYK